MKVIKHNKSEVIEMLGHWANAIEDFVLPAYDMLPESIFVLYTDEGHPSYAMSVYNTDSKLAWIGWQLKNPTLKHKGGLSYLIRRVTEFLELSGYRYILTTSNTPPVISALSDNGYRLGDEGVNHYIKIL